MKQDAGQNVKQHLSKLVRQHVGWHEGKRAGHDARHYGHVGHRAPQHAEQGAGKYAGRDVEAHV